jgi:hypothetical protein
MLYGVPAGGEWAASRAAASPASIELPDPDPPAGPASDRVAAGAAASPAPVSDLEGESPDPGAADRERGETKEKEFLAAFQRLGREEPEALDDLAADLLPGDGPDSEKVALLRALRDVETERAAEHWLLVLRELPDESDAQGESVPSTALLLLDRKAPRDAWSRDLLRRAVFETPRPASELRRRAAASFFRHAIGDELFTARVDLRRESDPLVLECALEALTRNRAGDPVAILLADHGRPAPEPWIEVQEP